MQFEALALIVAALFLILLVVAWVAPQIERRRGKQG
jgi:hypothetical protein